MAHKAQSKNERAANAELGRHIATLRKQRGFTQVELAKRLDVSQAIISNYERGRVRPHPGFILKVAEILAISTVRTQPHRWASSQLG